MWSYVAVGGMLGTLARYYLQSFVQPRGNSFPVATLLINVLGSLVLGAIARYAAATPGFSPELRVGLTVGLCGGFTTMSAFAFETVTLLGLGQYARAGVYLTATIVGSMGAVIVGAAIAGKLV